MLEHLWLPGMVTVAAIALFAILFKEFPKKRAGQTVGEDSTRYDYEVFLSFRGPDTRSGFIDFLYISLTDAGICTFKDDEELRIGEEFSSELLRAINQSKISIPIFSKGYASSAWCLKELAHMVKCQKTKEQKIMPIFYDVAPLEVRHQTGSYGEAFLSHENNKRYDEKTLREWKAALEKVSFLNGWDLHNMPNRQEGKFAKEVTQTVFTVLKKAHLVVSDYLVNVDNQVDEIMKMIGAQSRGTRIIGMHGMGGIGKTTIAKLIYNKLSHDFENCCFLPDIRETSKVKGIPYLQNQLISDVLKMECKNIKYIEEGTQTIKDKLSNKRVLLLLDDVEEYNHISALVSKGDWLREGSTLIITTRNKDVLKVLEMHQSYEVNTMDPDQSLKLFSKHAFGRDYPLDEYIVQSNKAIKIAGGLPLALEVMGSLLYRKTKEMWDATLEKLANVPHNDVQSKLKISYDALDEGEKEIFLDIACHFIEYDKDILIYFWDEPKLFPKVTMEVLQNMFLIKIKDDNKVWMHDQFRDLGRDIVRKKSNKKIEMQRRVWDPKEALDLLRKHKGKKRIEALRLKLDNQKQYCFSYESFESLSDLRFLEVDGPMENFHVEERLLWHESPSNVFPTNENSDLLPQLRWLSWRHIPPAFNITIFSMEDVVILNLSQSEIMDDWKGWSHIKVMKNLKVLDLSSCKGLQRTPIFSSHLNLERLILCGCQSLIEIDASICQLKYLVSLDISRCRNLRRLPDKFGRGLANLEYLSLYGCNLLERLPDSIGNLESLIELKISSTLIKELPDSIGNLKKLSSLYIGDTAIAEIQGLGCLENLRVLRLHGLGQVKVLSDLTNLNQLMSLQVISCDNLVEIQGEPQSLEVLRIDSCKSLRKLPNLSRLIRLREVCIKKL